MYLDFCFDSGANYILKNVSGGLLTQVLVRHPQADQFARFRVLKGKDKDISVTGKLFDLEDGESVQVQIKGGLGTGSTTAPLSVSFNDGSFSRTESHPI